MVDWRAPMAEPFYRATGRDPQGLVLRRHLALQGRQVVGVEDERFGRPGRRRPTGRAPTGDGPGADGRRASSSSATCPSAARPPSWPPSTGPGPAG